MLPATPKSKQPRRPLTPWELPSLLAPVHSHRKQRKKPKTERSHFPAVLGFVYRNHFAVASQIQRRFSSVLRSDRTTRRHLEELEALRYLAVAPGRGVGPLFPKVYYVTGCGVRRLRESLTKQGKPWRPSRIDRRGRDSREGYAADRIIHEILITEFLLALWQTVEQRPDLQLLSVQRRSLVKHPAFQSIAGGRSTRLAPDAMFLFRQKDCGMCCCFLELDNGTMNRKQIEAKLARYVAWSKAHRGQQFLMDCYGRHGAQNPHPRFRLLIVVRSRTGLDDDSRAAELLAVARRMPRGARNALWLTTAAILREHQHDEHPLGATIWLRVPEPERLSDSVSLEKQTSQTSRHELFPTTVPE